MDYFLIDGYNLSFRAFYAMPELTNSKGFPTGALHAFFSSILKLSSIDVPHSTAIFFDKGGSQARRELYADYKANRAQMSDALRLQMPEIQRLCSLMGFAVIIKEGIEADDLLASAAIKLSQNGKITIVSSDKDFAQVIRAGIRQLLPPQKSTLPWRELDTVGVRLKFGVSANQIPDYLALVGDTADNIKGLDGVGPKTAAKWLKDFGNLETIIKRASWIKPDKFQKLIPESEELLRRNLKLVTFDLNCLSEEIESTRPDFDGVIKFLESMDMKRAISAFKKFAQEQYQISL